MSWRLQALVSERKCGSSTRRLLMLAMSARANDDGSGVYASVPTIAAWCEIDARSIRRILIDLRNDGLIILTGERKVSRGYINEWALVVDAIKALPHIEDELQARREAATATPDTVSPLTPCQSGHSVTPDRVSAVSSLAAQQPLTECQPSSNLTPDTVSTNSKNKPLSSEATLPQTSPRQVAEKRGSRLPTDWRPNDHLRGQCLGFGLESWQVDAVLVEFVDFWAGVAGARGRKLDWDATFRNRCREVAGDRRMRDRLIRAIPAAVVTPEVWAKRLAWWRESRANWNPVQWGPPPDQPGYRGPQPSTDVPNILFSGEVGRS